MMIIDPFRFGAGGPAAGDVEYFLAKNAATQTVTATNTAEIVLGTEVFDTFTAFASNRFAVPSGMNGYYAVFAASVAFSPTSTAKMALSLERSTDGGSSWTVIAGDSNLNVPGGGLAVHQHLATGEIYRCTFKAGAVDQTLSLSDLVQFGAIIMEPVA